MVPRTNIFDGQSGLSEAVLCNTVPGDTTLDSAVHATPSHETETTTNMSMADNDCIEQALALDTEASGSQAISRYIIRLKIFERTNTRLIVLAKRRPGVSVSPSTPRTLEWLETGMRLGIREFRSEMRQVAEACYSPAVAIFLKEFQRRILLEIETFRSVEGQPEARSFSRPLSEFIFVPISSLNSQGIYRINPASRQLDNIHSDGVPHRPRLELWEDYLPVSYTYDESQGISLKIPTSAVHRRDYYAFDGDKNMMYRVQRFTDNGTRETPSSLTARQVLLHPPGLKIISTTPLDPRCLYIYDEADDRLRPIQNQGPDPRPERLEKLNTYVPLWEGSGIPLPDSELLIESKHLISGHPYGFDGEQRRLYRIVTLGTAPEQNPRDQLAKDREELVKAREEIAKAREQLAQDRAEFFNGKADLARVYTDQGTDITQTSNLDGEDETAPEELPTRGNSNGSDGEDAARGASTNSIASPGEVHLRCGVDGRWMDTHDDW